MSIHSPGASRQQLTLLPGAQETVTFDATGTRNVSSNVHSWMSAYVVVLDHPYFSAGTDDGTFEIRDVPVGHHSIRAWHAKFGTVTLAVTVAADAVTEIDPTLPGDTD